MKSSSPLPWHIPLHSEPLLSSLLNPDEAIQLAKLFRVLGEPARLQLLSYLASQAGGEACVCELTELLNLSQPTISHHLKVMYEAGLLDKERRGSWIYYRIVPEQIAALQNSLSLAPQSSDKHMSGCDNALWKKGCSSPQLE